MTKIFDIIADAIRVATFQDLPKQDQRNQWRERETRRVQHGAR